MELHQVHLGLDCFSSGYHRPLGRARGLERPRYGTLLKLDFKISYNRWPSSTKLLYYQFLNVVYHSVFFLRQICVRRSTGTLRNSLNFFYLAYLLSWTDIWEVWFYTSATAGYYIWENVYKLYHTHVAFVLHPFIDLLPGLWNSCSTFCNCRNIHSHKTVQLNLWYFYMATFLNNRF